MADATKERLRELVLQMRKQASAVGTLHGSWDYIFDIEAFLDGKPTLLNKTADEWVAIAEARLS